uniref:Uncharacterized protein n=1 Tax=Brassica oleracea TaxID=3712 RepID=A0A3P6CAV2_BRAOL|nr:unnamed protein product [Brassica oleracea]
MGEEKSVNNYDIVYIGHSSNSNDDHSISVPPSISETFPCHILLPNLSKCSPSTTDSRNYAWRTITLRHTILRAYFNISSTKKNAKASIIYAKHPLVSIETVLISTVCYFLH